MPSAILADRTRLRFGPSLPSDIFSTIRRRMILDYCKWDPQVGDESVLLEQPLILGVDDWTYLATSAEKMAEEINSAEAELLAQPRLMAQLAMPASLLRVLRPGDSSNALPTVRTLRFDFHPTLEGWQTSEVNSDVPGGFAEASYFTAMMAVHYPGTRPAGDPLQAWTTAMTKSPASTSEVAILYAPGYMEDQQIATLLGSALTHEGCAVHFAQSPGELRWRDGRACFYGMRSAAPLGAIVRFYQAEWLAKLPRRAGWHHLFSKSRTMVANPGYAVLSESKRWPLIWKHLSSPTDTLQSMFPECREPNAVDSDEENWVFKAAYSNTGDDVIMPSSIDAATWKKQRKLILRRPDRWVAQRRFTTTRISADSAEFSPCIGVYTINGRAEGAYVRLARGSIVDYRACEAALLIDERKETHP